MKDITKKVVILDNLTSPYIYQAIILLNDNAPSGGGRIIADAEKIVNDYLVKLKADEQEVTLYTRPHIKPSSKKSGFSFFLACSLTALSAIILFLLLR